MSELVKSCQQFYTTYVGFQIHLQAKLYVELEEELHRPAVEPIELIAQTGKHGPHAGHDLLRRVGDPCRFKRPVQV